MDKKENNEITRKRIQLARLKGITIKEIASASGISLATLYTFNCSARNLSNFKLKRLNEILSDMGVQEYV